MALYTNNYEKDGVLFMSEIKPQVLVITGKSGSGKDTLAKELIKRYPDVYKESIEITSRPIRQNEVNGVDKIFVTKDKFLSMVKEDKIMEYRQYDVVLEDGEKDVWYYGHTYPTESTTILTGPFVFLSRLAYSKQDELDIIPVYIHMDDQVELFMRGINREIGKENPNFREVCRRFLSDMYDFSDEFAIPLVRDHGMHIIETGNIDEMCEKVFNITLNRNI